jgi:Ser-tRNA(Ala) deacylase AlaX
MITKIPNYQILKNDIELIEYVATQIKNLIKTPNYDLPTIIVEIFTNVFSLSNDEQTALKKVIEYLINNKTIQKISKLTKLSNSVYSVVKKKIL